MTPWEANSVVDTGSCEACKRQVRGIDVFLRTRRFSGRRDMDLGGVRTRGTTRDARRVAESWEKATEEARESRSVDV